MDHSHWSIRAGRGAWTWGRRIVVGVVGGAVLLAGIIMLVAPGPGLLGVAAGLGILATEFPSVRRGWRIAYVRGRRRARQWRDRRKR